MKKLSAIIFALLMIVGTVNANDKEERPMHELHSMLVFNFLKYIEWPENAKGGKFTIAVIGDQDVYESLKALYSSRKISGMSVEIMNYGSEAEVNHAHLVFLSAAKSNEFDALKSKFDGKSTLLITDKNGLGKKGSCINFKLVGGKLKFEINEEAINNANLKVSNQLMAMGMSV